MSHSERMVTLTDGREVSNYSELWREECEARFVCNMRGYWVQEGSRGRRVDGKQARRLYLAGVERKRGYEARTRLEAAVRVVWNAEFARAE